MSLKSPEKQAVLAIPDRPRAELTLLAGRLFDLETVSVEVGVDVDPLRIDFTRVRDPDQVLDQACARETTGEASQRVPYWAAVWESAQGVVGHLLGSGLLRPGLKVLDLGCGMGLAGTLLAKAGCDVTMVDYEEESLMVARINAVSAGVPVRVGLCDWRTDRLGERFELIVGSDVLYETEQWPFLESFWKVQLESGGRVVLGEPCRPKADDFADWVTLRGWQVRLIEHQTVEAKRIRVFTLDLK